LPEAAAAGLAEALPAGLAEALPAGLAEAAADAGAATLEAGLAAAAEDAGVEATVAVPPQAASVIESKERSPNLVRPRISRLLNLQAEIWPHHNACLNISRVATSVLPGAAAA